MRSLFPSLALNFRLEGFKTSQIKHEQSFTRVQVKPNWFVVLDWLTS